MEFAATFTKGIERALVTLIVITVFCSTSNARNQASSFSSRVNDAFDFGAEKEQEFSEGHSRVKRQTLPQCYGTLTCSSPTINRFRTIDGTCNNLATPDCGAAEIPFIRWLPRSPPGQGFRCPSCPRPRDVSSRITNILPAGGSDGITLMVMQWGQFIDHDMVFTPEDPDAACCQDFQTPSGSTASCSPIDVTGDAFYSSLSTPVTCLPFVRSTAATCQVGTTPAGADRENINELTAYLDGSAVYGSSNTIANNLRLLARGELRVGPDEDLPCSGAADVCPRTFLPIETSGGQDAFLAGDARVEQLPALTSLHTLFVRLHNFLAELLFNNGCPGNGGLGPDELIYQVVRKIVVALIQQITYDEFLPIVLGNYMNRYRLTLNPATTSFNTFNNGYDQDLCASTPSVFATAAFRFGHSLIPNQFETINGPVLLERNFNNHFATLNPGFQPSHFIDALITQASMPVDQIVSQSVTNKLFAQGPNFEFGSDLVSRNIKRGRDHGIPGYVEWFNDCEDFNGFHGGHITSFSDLDFVMPANVADALEELYRNVGVENVDLFPAGIAETEMPGALLGPTFACIIAEHFQNLKFADRFWFERPGFFTVEQIQSIRRTKLAALVCFFTAVEESRIDVMLLSSAIRDCELILNEGLINDILFTTIWDDICFQ